MEFKTVKYRLSDIRQPYDGDTFTARFWYGDELSEPLRIRIFGIDCPEIKGRSEKERGLAIRARDFSRKTLMNAAEVTAIVRGVDVYDRVLCDVHADGKALKSSLIENGLAKTYEGQKRRWD